MIRVFLGNVGAIVFSCILPQCAIASAATGPADWQAHILARPLFTPTRRPATMIPAFSRVPRLSGLIEETGNKRALFAIPGQEHSVIVKLHSTIGSWTIIDIDQGKVKIRDEHGIRTLRPERDRQDDQHHSHFSASSVSVKRKPSIPGMSQ